MPAVEPTREGVRLHLKVVPGASRSQVVGWHGDRLRVRVAAPPEGGKANRAVCELLAAHFGAARGAVAVVAGASSPNKTVAIDGVSAAEVEARL